MNASAGSALGIGRSSALRMDDVRLPTWISISAPPTPVHHGSPTRRSPPAARRRTNGYFQPTSKRNIQPSFVINAPTPTTNALIELCQKKQWNEVLTRCQSYPHETVPIPQMGPSTFTHHEDDDKELPPMKRDRKNCDVIPPSPCASLLQPIHQETPLGIACKSEFETSDQMLQVVENLLAACPEQVQSNEGVTGHTPLRSAIRNHQCTPQLLRLLVIADMKLLGNLCDKAVFRRDRDGLSPVDHLVMGVHTGSPSHSLECLGALIQTCPQVVDGPHSETCSCFVVSPLIRLLSMGTSFGLHMRANTTNRSRRSRARRKHDSGRMTRILECAKSLVTDNVSNVSSRSTKCTALHVAIRNYGNMLPLIQLLLESDANHVMVRKRNLYGDLPLHVACSVGVPTNVLSLLLRHTIAAITRPDDVPHPLVWSVNKSGYTPVDLEWMRHIEGGRGFFEVRSFYPLEASGIPNQCIKQDKFYRDLLQEAVDQVIQGPAPVSNRDKSRKHQASALVGALLDRIVLVVQVANKGQLVNQKGQSDLLLHAASALSRIPGATLPIPLMRLFEWMHPEQIYMRDEMGRLPLHHALMPPSKLSSTTDVSVRNTLAVDRTSWVQTLLERSSSSAYVADKEMRLPLHYALDCRSLSKDCKDKEEPESQISDGLEQRKWRSGVIKQLVDAFPDSVDRRDPESHLYPFMQVAQDPDSSLDDIFFLLRRNPALVQSGIATV